MPTGRFNINAGVRRIAISKEGYETKDEEYNLTGGEKRSLHVVLEAKPIRHQGSIQPPLARASASEEHSLGAGFWVSFVATTVAAGATTTFALMTRKADKDYDDELQKYPASSAWISDADRKLQRYALLTDISAGVTAICLGTTLYFGLSSDDDDSERPKAGELTVRTGPVGTSWQVMGTF